MISTKPAPSTARQRGGLRRVLGIAKIALWSLLLSVVLIAALLGYYVYSPDAAEPPLSGSVTRGILDVGGLKRTYLLYAPRALPDAAPLVMVLHGSGESGSQIRMETGYGFDRLADARGFAVVYPDSRSFDWNDCSTVGDFEADGRDVDDLAFLDALAGRLSVDLHLDRRRLFAAGVSAGGFMAIRLAIEDPSRFRAIAAVSAAVPAPENFKCRPIGAGTSVLLVNGSRDPLVPFDGGEVSLFGLFYKTGKVLSAPASVRWFAALNGARDEPTMSRLAIAEGIGLERSTWHGEAGVDIELVAIVGGGHGLPQAAWRRPRLLGPSPMAPDGPALIWSFFDRPRP